MENCYEGISIPEGIAAPCGGEYKSTDCILSPDALTYLGLPANASQTQINIAIQASLRAKDEMIDEIDGSETKLSAGSNVTITGNGTFESPYVVTAVSITKTSDLTNDGSNGTEPFITAAQVSQPTLTSQLNNDGANSTSVYVEADDLAVVATSGSYNDLSDKPTVATVLESIDEGNGLGIIIKNRIASNYGNIGQGAIDLSYSSEISTIYGATGLFSFAEGFNNISSGFASRSSGAYTEASADYASAEGSYTVASGYAAHAEGEDSVASGNLSHAQGDSVASGSHAHSEGLNTIASGDYSHAQGRENFARSVGEHSGGMFGTDYTPTGTDTDRLVNYGNGTSGADLSDAFTILKNGLATLPSVGNGLIDADPTGKSIITKEYLDSKIPTITVPNLQEVINVNKTADRVEFSHDVINGGQVRGSFVYLTSRGIDTLDTSKTYMYGAFDSFDNIITKNIARINNDGSLDSTFVTGTGFNVAPLAGSNILIGTDGKLYVSGSFTNYNGTTANYIISLNNDGSVNTTFSYGSGFNNLTSGMGFNVAKNTVYVTGSYSSYNGQPTNRIVKLNLDGTVDSSFVYGTGFDNATVGVFVDSDDDIFVTGYFSNYNGTSSPRLIKLNSDGTVDTSFVVGTSYNTAAAEPNFIFRNSQGVLITYGYFTSYNGTPANRIVALNGNGSVNTSVNFGSGFNGAVSYVQELPNGKYIVEGSFDEYRGEFTNGIIMLNSDFTIFKLYEDIAYYNTIVGSSQIFAMTFVGDYEQLLILSDGLPVTKKVLSFSEVSGKAEYKIGGLTDTTTEELLPKRLIEELILNKAGVKRDFKYYEAIIEYSGGAGGAFTIRTLENELGDEVVWTRTGGGAFRGTLTGAFPKPSTSFLTSGIAGVSTIIGSRVMGSNDALLITLYDTLTSAYVDDSFDIHVRVKVYPEVF